MTEISRDDLLTDYLGTLPYEPYPVQEDALVAWFSDNQGVLVCAPTGTGKTLIAEAAVYEALRTGRSMYYTTPLIALTDQKFRELRESAVRWGYEESAVGLVTGNRTVNADAPILVVVAEVLFNRLLHQQDYDFGNTASVVMDEFHSFNDGDRGIVWEFSLGLLPAEVRTMLLSATVGNSRPFTRWLATRQNRTVELVESTVRKVPLTFTWVGDELLPEFIEGIATGTDEARRTPALLFVFNRDGCWNVADTLRGKAVVTDAQKKQLSTRLEDYDMSTGAGPKLKELLKRGIGIHHAGVLPKYRRVVEDLFQEKLLSVCVCTETLAAGINLPARSVILPSIVTGPKTRRRIIDAANAHQMFGRAGRPQYDDEGFVFALAHEDDVRIARWKEKLDQIPEDTKDPNLRKARKAIEKKKPRKRDGETYWTEEQFAKLRDAPAADLASKGAVPWRLLAYMLDASPEVARIRELIGRRLLDTGKIEIGNKDLDAMLKLLSRAGYVTVEPDPPPSWTPDAEDDTPAAPGTVGTDGRAVGDDEDENDDEGNGDDAPVRPTMLFGQALTEESDDGKTTGVGAPTPSRRPTPTPRRRTGPTGPCRRSGWPI